MGGSGPEIATRVVTETFWEARSLQPYFLDKHPPSVPPMALAAKLVDECVAEASAAFTHGKDRGHLPFRAPVVEYVGDWIELQQHSLVHGV